MANDSQNPPYDDRAVAPNVLPTAISLIRWGNFSIGENQRAGQGAVNIPHASKKLYKTTISECKCDDNIRHSDIESAEVDQAQNESSQCESAQTERSWIGEFTVLDSLVQTRLEFTSEGWEAGGVGRASIGQRTIAESSSLGGYLMLFVAHIVWRSVESQLGICHALIVWIAVWTLSLRMFPFLIDPLENT